MNKDSSINISFHRWELFPFLQSSTKATNTIHERPKSQ
uniref:Uncharacterized protein n=1 Tax=Lepeophtheirus salmonis TaxID=72036 RepID=A0A0K2ULH4_LEPSM